MTATLTIPKKVKELEIRPITPKSTVFISLFKREEYKDKSIGNRFWMEKLPESQKKIVFELDRICKAAHSYRTAKFLSKTKPFDEWINIESVGDAVFAYWAIRQVLWIGWNEFKMQLYSSFSENALECVYLNAENQMIYRVMFVLKFQSEDVEEEILSRYEVVYEEPRHVLESSKVGKRK